jgi:hypothetical protein
MGINFFRGLEGQIGDHAAQAHGLAFCGNQSVAQPESPETAGIGDMALGPVGGKPYFRGSKPFPKGRVHRSNSLNPSLFQYGDKVISQFDVELFTEVPGMSPEQGGILGLFAIAFSDIFKGRENPRDH